jgi:hypothetical protein
VLSTSSHHCIHGNGSKHVKIHDIICEDFEVCGFSLNGFEHAEIRDVEIRRIRMEVPVLGIWSAGRFILPYLEYLIDSGSTTTLRVQGREKDATCVYNELVRAQKNVYEDIACKKRVFISYKDHPEEHELFHNARQCIDGNAYGINFNRLGVAVSGLALKEDAEAGDTWSKDIVMENVDIWDLHVNVEETVGLKDLNEDNKADFVAGAQKDPVGAMF